MRTQLKFTLTAIFVFLFVFQTFSQINRGYIVEETNVKKGFLEYTLLPGSTVEVLQKFQTTAKLLVLKGSTFTTSVNATPQTAAVNLIVNCKIADFNTIDFTVRADNLTNFWQQQLECSDAYQNLMKNGVQANLRTEWSQTTKIYIQSLEDENLFLEDPELETYLTELVQRMYPGQIAGRPGNVVVKVMKEFQNAPNAFAFPDGTIVINTRLLAILHTEAEIAAVLAHELAHFMLDHSLISKLKEQRRQTTALVTTLVLGTTMGVAAAASGATAEEATDLGLDMMDLTATIAFGIAEDAGFRYSRENEFEADGVAAQLLDFIGIEPTAMSTALNALKIEMIQLGQYSAFTGRKDTHPSLDDRITVIGTPAVYQPDMEYEKAIASVLTFNALIDYKIYENPQGALSFIGRNEHTNRASTNDLYMKACIYFDLYDNSEKNVEALNYLNTIKNNDDKDWQFYKVETQFLIREKRYREALSSIENYNHVLKGLKIEYSEDSDVLKTIYAEISWCEAKTKVIEDFLAD